MLGLIKGLFIEEEGQGMTEYGLILGLIAIGAVAALGFLGDEVVKVFDNIKGKLTGSLAPKTP